MIYLGQPSFFVQTGERKGTDLNPEQVTSGCGVLAALGQCAANINVDANADTSAGTNTDASSDVKLVSAGERPTR